MSGFAKKQKDLRNVLLYTQELLSFNDKVIYDIASEPYPYFLENQISELEGVEINVDDETWLRVRRLRETSPPEHSPIFAGWVNFGHHPSPDQPPKLAAERMLRLSIEEISDLMEAGLVIDANDVMRPIQSDETHPEVLDVILRIANMPEFRALWQQYLDSSWAEWVKFERPRRRSINFYNKLYQTYQRILSLGDDNPIELVFGVGMARWRIGDNRINAPLIEQSVELELEEDGTILLRPRTVQPQVTLRPFHALEIEGSKSLQKDVAQQFERMLDDPDVGFSPFVSSTFETLLRTCAARLSATGLYLPDDRKNGADRSLPDITEMLTISDTWVIYVRQRNEDFRKDDIQRLIKRIDEIEDENDLPPPGRRFVEEPSNERLYENSGSIDLTSTHLVLPETTRGWNGNGSSSEGSGGEKKDETFFFPLPYNDDQIEIIRRLEEPKADGVLVQGPPGTGKTHTIANIICHYLATKRRVLVTAKTPEALTALQEKLPEGIRDLAIAVIHNDREGARQLEQAVRVLADEAKSINPKVVSQNIAERQARLSELKQSIQDIDKELYAYAERNLHTVVYGEETLLPMDLARIVSEDRAHHNWFNDQLTLAAKFDPQFTDADIAEVQSIRNRLSGDLIYQLDDFPDPSALPDLPRLLAAHGELTRINEINSRSDAGEIPFMSLEETGIDHAKEVREWLGEFSNLMKEVSTETWLVSAYHTLLGLKRTDLTVVDTLRQSFDSWVCLHDQGRQLSLKAVTVGEVSLDDQAFNRALEDLAVGKQPFGLFSFLKGGLKAQIEKVSIEGRAPVTADEWKVVHAYRAWQREVKAFFGRWSAIARVIGASGLSHEDEFFRLGRLVDGLWSALAEIESRRTSLSKLFPYGIDIDEVLHSGRCQLALEALSVNLEKAELADAYALKTQLNTLIGARTLPWHAGLQQVVANLGSGEVKQAELAEAWKQIVAEAKRLDSLRNQFQRLDILISKVSASGAPNWAVRLRNEASGQVPWSVETWRDTWQWARAHGFIHSLSDRDQISRLSEQRAIAEAEQKKLFAEVVRLRTFLGLKQNLTAKVEAALAKFAAAIARLGKGTGKAAGRHRRIIRDSTLDTAQAVPCWILPEWRVSEQLPAELAVFDLVVVDEASQSDITALPAILRGKKVLIVGDDRQVSPTPIGIEDRKIVQLRTTFLTGLPFADQMDPATSLYELGGMAFPGKAIMLREHFRCVEPIIRFSSRFYPNPLVPLRVPKATERLDPPLIDIYVPHGRKLRDVNEAEAAVIVEEISKLVADPTFEKRTIGVISLIGDKQAKVIYDRLMQDLGAEVIERHHIMCGNAATYQGQERDIIFLSMVACPETAKSQTARIIEQRYNVALSRARDRMVLVRSVASSHLKPGDLKLAVIEHFRNPMEGSNISQTKEILDLCDSGFEKDFGKRMLAMGYRLRPQVPVGGYRIDFVIEGHHDRRLAVELDGDKYHGPERWAEDVRRQKALERLGWTFWRCWGSNWIADPEGCISDLKIVLDRLGIEPIGAQPINTVYTQHIEVPAPDQQPVIPLATELNNSALSVTPVIEPDEAREDEVPNSISVLDANANWKQLKTKAPAYPVSFPIDNLPTFAIENEVAEIGDLVVIRYNDAPDRPLRIRLSRHESRPGDGIIRVDEPIGAAILGASVDDEVEVNIGGKNRTAIIERIEKMQSRTMEEA